MLRIYDDMLDVLRSMRGAIDAIEKRDADLARQLRRAASSVVLNMAEGSGSFGRVRTARYRTALGSARETLACLRVGEALGYIDAVPESVTQPIDRVIGTLVRVAA
jgi:four helix bundle protein